MKIVKRFTDLVMAVKPDPKIDRPHVIAVKNTTLRLTDLGIVVKPDVSG